jgi:hypothetical protein
VLATAEISKFAATFLEVVADLIDLLDDLRDVSLMLAAALGSISALTSKIIVADLIGHIRAFSLAGARLAVSDSLLGGSLILGTGGSRSTSGTGLLHETRAIILRSMEETARVAVFTRSGLGEVVALTTGRLRDGLTLNMLVVALIAVTALAGVSECAANLGHRLKTSTIRNNVINL